MSIRIGFAPTRRSIFSAPDARKYAGLIREKLAGLGVDFVDITEFNDDGLLYDPEDGVKIAKKFKEQNVDALFVPHCNFGCEYAVASLAREMGKPVLLWGPRDERPDERGIRLRDTQCGLFATGKALRRFQVPFTYLKNCRIDDAAFAEGIDLFLRVASVVKMFRGMRILQISTRPYDFLTTMCNEGELLERFDIRLAPLPMTELMDAVKTARADRENINATVSGIRGAMDVRVTDEALESVAALKLAMRSLADGYGCQAIALQCWDALQTEIGIMPCAANALLTDEGLPVACETDIHGAITSVLMQAAQLGAERPFFADWTVRHPDNEYAELLQHCGPWPLSIAQVRPALDVPLAFDHPGSVSALAKDGVVTLARFDGDGGEYSLLMGPARTVEGPYTKGTYMWVEVDNLDELEEKLVRGPYVHHCSGVYGDVVPVLYEACRYLGVTPDPFGITAREIEAAVRGEKA